MKAIKNFFFGTYIRGFVSFYALFTFTGAALLKLPVSLLPGQSISWIDAIFVSVSGMSTTGLSTITVATTFSAVGKVILAMILQFGGIGLIMLLAMFWMITGKRITFRERQMIMTDQNQFKMSGAVKLVRNVLIVLFTVELIGFVIMGSYLYFAGYYELQEAFFQAFFLTISMTTNAGFDISGTSLFQYATDFPMQILAMFLMFTGAVGFWPLMEFREWLKAKRNKESYQFSSFTKLLIKLHVGLWIIGAVFVWVAEYDFFVNSGFSLIESTFYGLFMSLTTRNAGFATIDVSLFGTQTKFFFAILMFLGSSPNSAGGGIRTTTLITIILALKAFATGRNQVVWKKRSIKLESVNKAFVVFVGAILLVFTATNLILIADSFTWEEVAFEVASAFGTTGLSLGITSSLSSFSKIVLIATMFIGRVGIVALLMLTKPQTSKNKVQYPEADIIIG